MDSREIFLEACNCIYNNLNDKEFKIFQKGQLFKKVSENRDIYFEIIFQSSFNNDQNHIALTPLLVIYAKKLKRLMADQTKNPYEKGILYHNTLGYISPLRTYKTWNVAGLNGKNSIKEVSDLLNSYALPLFNIFNNIENAITFLTEHGAVFNKYTEDSVFPLGFMIHYATKNQAEIFFNNWVSKLKYKNKVFALYKELETSENINLMYSEFIGATQVKLAYINGLKLYNK